MQLNRGCIRRFHGSMRRRYHVVLLSCHLSLAEVKCGTTTAHRVLEIRTYVLLKSLAGRHCGYTLKGTL